MLELVMLIAACVVMYRAADAEQMSGVLWVIITVVICGALFALMPQWAMVRVLIGAVLTFVAMIGWNIYRSR